MRRLLILALLPLAVFAAPAAAHTSDPSVTCAEPADASATTTVAPAGGDGGSSGGTPVSWDGGDVSTGAAEAPTAVVAQEPEPEPEGPGEEQPGDPGGEPQQPSPPVETPGGEAPGEAPGTDTGGGLPRTGLEAFQLAFLGIVLLLTGARLRVLALRRRRPASGTHREEPAWTEAEEPAYAVEARAPSHADEVTVRAYADEAEEPVHADAGDEWAFPDPDEPAPTGLLPSTATARRQARLRELDPSTAR